jgi:iron(III) transport system substrate-binding protein
MPTKRWLATASFAAALLAFLIFGPSPALAQAAASPPDDLVVYCPHPVDFIDAIVQEFEVETGLKVEVVAGGTGELLKRIEGERAAPRGDLMWGGSRASLEQYRNLFEPYVSGNESAFLPGYADAAHTYTPFTAVPTVFMYNRNLMPPSGYPRGWAELLDPRWRGKIAFADPAVSSSSFEALVNMLFAMGKGDPEKGWQYVALFVGNLGGRLLGGSSEVYGGVASGEYAIGVTFEEAAAIYRRQGAPVGIVYPAEGTIVEPDGVAIIKGARNSANARLFVDFVSSRKVQAKIARDLNRRSCRTDVPAATGLLDLGSIHIIQGDYRWAAANKERILERFRRLAKGS